MADGDMVWIAVKQIPTEQVCTATAKVGRNNLSRKIRAPYLKLTDARGSEDEKTGAFILRFEPLNSLSYVGMMRVVNIQILPSTQVVQAQMAGEVFRYEDSINWRSWLGDRWWEVLDADAFLRFQREHGIKW